MDGILQSVSSISFRTFPSETFDVILDLPPPIVNAKDESGCYPVNHPWLEIGQILGVSED
jgi:hypothetical protein